MFVEVVVILLVVPVVQLLIGAEYIGQIVDHTVELSRWELFQVDVRKDFAVQIFSRAFIQDCLRNYTWLYYKLN